MMFSEKGHRFESLARLAQAVTGSLELPDVLDRVARAATDLLPDSASRIWVVEGDCLAVRSESGTLGPPRSGRKTVLAMGEGLVGHVAVTREPLVVAGVLADRRTVNVEWFRQERYVSSVHIPLLVRDRLVGVLALFTRHRHHFITEEVEILASFGAQAAIAIENARFYAETARRLDETQALLEVAEILSSTQDSKELLKRLAIKTAQVCRVDRCTIELWEGERAIPLMSQFADGRKALALWEKFRAIRPYTPQEIPAHAIAIQTKKPVLIPDTSGTDLIPKEWIGTYGMRAYLVVPVMRHDRVVGVMNLDYCDRNGSFDQRQVGLAMMIGGQVALALENSRLYTEIHERLRETETLLAVGGVFALNLPTQEAMRRVAREIARAFQADMVGAYFLDGKKEALVPVAGHQVPKDLLPTLLQTPLPLSRFPFLEEAWKTGKPVWTPDYVRDDRFDHKVLAGIRSPRAVLFAPTPVRGEIVGGLFLVWWTRKRHFTSTELRLIEGVASQVGLALGNAELVRQTEEKLRETETLLSVSRALSSTLDLHPLIRHLLRQVAATIEADSVGVWLVHQETRQLHPFAGYHVPPRLLDSLRNTRITLGESPFHFEGLSSRRVMVSSNVPEDPRIPASLKVAVPHRAQLFAPIVAKEGVIGAFIAVWWDRTREFSEREVALVEAMGSQAGIALANARLFQENQRKLKELSVLYELSRAVTGQLNIDQLVQAIHRQVGRVLDARNMGVLLYDEGSKEFEVALRMLEGCPDPDPIRRYPRGRGLVSVVVGRRRPIRTADYGETCRREEVEPVPSSLSFRHWLGVPMIAGDQTVGVLALRSADHPFAEADERLLTNIARLAALAVRNARLFEEKTLAYDALAAAQDQLIRTEKLRALGEMASGIAHDFNNLLAAILGRAQLVLQHVEDPTLRQWLQVIDQAAMDGAQTVRRIQEFTRIRRDQPFVAVNLNLTVQEALEVTQSRWRDEAQSRGIAIQVDTSLARVPAVAGDPVELREALTNLILNAVDAMPTGGTLSLGTFAVGDQVVLTVSDSGQGMSEDVQRRIFDPFFTTKGPQGTGLGLSMTFGIVTRHGGEISVQSTEGKGSTFRLTFPVSQAPLPPSRPDEMLPTRTTRRCLVVDDEPLVRQVLGDLLSQGGHEAVLAAEGGEAIERFKLEPFDLVITDLGMPGLNGFQVAQAVKDHDPLVPVFLVTGWGVEHSDEELKAKGVDRVLAKPLKLDDILSAVAACRPRKSLPGGSQA
ncbi:MAG: GAF domain-containing protein [Candidatus Methylomirabilia bacterium]